MTREEMRMKLCEWGNALERIERLENDLKSYRQWADDARNTLHATSLTGMPGGGVKQDMTDRVIEIMRRGEKYDAEIGRINERIGQILERKKKIDELIENALDVREAEIVEMRYRSGMSWAAISEKTNYSEEHVKHLDIRIVNRMMARWSDG